MRHTLWNAARAGAVLIGLAGMFASSAVLAESAESIGSLSHAPVPRHPFLADSPYAMGHVNAAVALNSAVAGFGDIGRALRPNEIKWVPLEYVSRIAYSGIYPNGKRVAWTGGGQNLFKLDADSMELLAKKEVMRIGIPMTAEDIARHVDKIDHLSDKEQLMAAVPPVATGLAPIFFPLYHNFLSNENEQYLAVNDLANKRLQIRVYGDAINGDPASDIALRREITLPDVDPGKVIIFSLTITYDGTVIVMLTDGTLFALSRDLKLLDRVALPHKAGDTGKAAGDKTEAFSSFVRNTMALDDEGGIYVATHDFIHRVQWTGKNLSLAKADGAWQVVYDSGPRGTGTSPNLMGWGSHEDKLVLTTSGTGPYLVAYWRGKIPDNWKGLPGEERRVAGRALVDFENYYKKGSIKEFTNIVKDNGIFFFNDQAVANYGKDVGYVSHAPNGGYAAIEEFLTFSFGSGQAPKYSMRTGLKLEWDSRKRKFVRKWRTMRAFAPGMPIVDKSNILYFLGAENKQFTLEGLDWNTGKQTFKYVLGSSQRFNPVGTTIEIAPNGAVDCPCGGGLGWLRILPKPVSTQSAP